MMEYVAQCIDKKTGRTLVLSDATYNMAMDWLQKEMTKNGKEIFRCESCGDSRTAVYTGTPKHDFDFDGNPTVWYTNIVRFFYDENRGVLLGEQVPVAQSLSY